MPIRNPLDTLAGIAPKISPRILIQVQTVIIPKNPLETSSRISLGSSLPRVFFLQLFPAGISLDVLSQRRLVASLFQRSKTCICGEFRFLMKLKIDVYGHFLQITIQFVEKIQEFTFVQDLRLGNRHTVFPVALFEICLGISLYLLQKFLQKLFQKNHPSIL